ncbi:flippase [Enterobacter asburiae]|uniref:flippase n=1 Tax=Enterobacter asburiae TaxID=61645 RepID=UPI001CBB428B|nr:flippase [Enterobacter asburiae]MDO2453911.1 flippase [Enterobacter asburiae]MDW3574007.1 flippase [Enterobacter asburiae]UAN15746.1 flippase [Enterobacter asburiae]
MSLIRNSIYNLAGFAIPTVVAIPALGLLARLLGPEAFGLFTLVFALIGYASIFDAGISRAVIREVSLNRENSEEQKNIISTASVVVVILGSIALFIMALSTTKIVELLNVTPNLKGEAIKTFLIVSFIIPFYLLNQVWLGYLEGLEKFANINIQRVISSTCLALLPALMCLIKPTLIYASYGLILGRIFSFLLTAFICKNIIYSSRFACNFITLKRLISFGGWITVSNIISPIMAYFDRFIISHLMGASRIAFYSAPSEGVSRLINIPYALARALFPKLSYCSDKNERRSLQFRSYLIISIICLPIVIVGVLFSSLIMGIWMGPEYTHLAANVLQILLIGFYFNALAQIPYVSLQALGKAKTTAALHLIELIPYLSLLSILTVKFGIIGTAIAWSVRTLCDLILLVILSGRK